MSFDFAAHMGAMSRTVASTTHDGKPAKAVIAARTYPTDPADLWDALTRPDRIRRWFAPVSGDLRLGGRYQVEGNAGGTITECEARRRVAMTWEFGGGVSWVTLTLDPDGAGTRLTLEHLAELTDEALGFWEQFGPGATGVGWDLSFLGLAQHLGAPEDYVLPPEERDAWAVSDEAKGLYRRMAAAWGEAAIADGETQEQARAAAERTRQFYSGETPPQG